MVAGDNANDGGAEVRSAVDITHPGGMRGNRVMPTPVRDRLDPSVVFERFFIAADQGFDTHPHRGFEIVSYMLEGGMVHDHSLGESHTAYPGDELPTEEAGDATPRPSSARVRRSS